MRETIKNHPFYCSYRCHLIRTATFYQSKQTFRFIFDENEVKDVLTQFKAQEISISADSMITFKLEQGRSVLQELQGNVTFISECR